MDPFNNNNQDNKPETGYNPPLLNNQLPVNNQIQPTPPTQEPGFIQPNYQPIVTSMPVSPITNGVPSKPENKSKLKLLIIIGSAILMLGAIGFVLWTFVFSGMPLKEYDGGTYTVLVPESYEKQVSSDDSQVTFSKPNVSEGDKRSYIEFSYVEYGDSENKGKYVEQLDKLLFDKNGAYTKDNETKANIVVTKNDKDNVVVRTMTADYKENDKIIGKTSMTMKFTDKGMFSITIMALSEDSGLISSSNKIADSLKEK